MERQRINQITQFVRIRELGSKLLSTDARNLWTGEGRIKVVIPWTLDPSAAGEHPGNWESLKTSFLEYSPQAITLDCHFDETENASRNKGDYV